MSASLHARRIFCYILHLRIRQEDTLINSSVNGTDDASPKTVAVIVAHPDDETLWAGGTILSHPSWKWHIVTLCRASDADRAPRFTQAVQVLGARGAMGDLDDGPDQVALPDSAVQNAIMALLQPLHYDLVISHSPAGEYTRHLRHEEVSRAVISLWSERRLMTRELWVFAYEDGGRRYYPKPMEGASIFNLLPQRAWEMKYRIITDTYGFPPDGFEARTTPRAEAFWRFTASSDAKAWMEQGGGRA